MVTTIINDLLWQYSQLKNEYGKPSHWIFTNTKQIILKGIFQDFHFYTIWLILIACRTMHPRLFKVAATSLKFRIRLHAHPVARTHDLVPKQFLRPSDWLMYSEVDYFALGLISGLDDGAATLNQKHCQLMPSVVFSLSLKWVRRPWNKTTRSQGWHEHNLVLK